MQYLLLSFLSEKKKLLKIQEALWYSLTKTCLPTESFLSDRCGKKIVLSEANKTKTNKKKGWGNPEISWCFHIQRVTLTRSFFSEVDNLPKKHTIKESLQETCDESEYDSKPLHFFKLSVQEITYKKNNSVTLVHMVARWHNFKGGQVCRIMHFVLHHIQLFFSLQIKKIISKTNIWNHLAPIKL